MAVGTCKPRTSAIKHSNVDFLFSDAIFGKNRSEGGEISG